MPDKKQAAKGAINKKSLLADEITSVDHDASFLSILHELPNPDVILKKLGRDQEVYNDILYDAHVAGEIRAMRSNILGYKYEIQLGADDANSIKAHQLVTELLARKPNKTSRWQDVIWTIFRAVFFGHSIHHVSWKVDGQYLVPDEIGDRPNRQFTFNKTGELLIRTTSNPSGEAVPEGRYLVTRHMPDHDNPFGFALLSTCFWPYTFKHGGFKFFVKFCQKYGIPWPIARYPLGTEDKDINTLVKSLKQLVEDAVAAVPEGNAIELLQAKTSGDTPQERLIALCDAQMSKALTSQTLATDIQGQGSRAASETHLKKSDRNGKTDRNLVSDTLNDLFELITVVNFGDNATPPKCKYVDKKELNKDDVTFISEAAKLMPIGEDFAYKRLGIPEPKGDEPLVDTSKLDNKPIEPMNKKEADFSAPSTEYNAIDQASDKMVGELFNLMFNNAESLAEIKTNIEKAFPGLDDAELAELLKQELMISYLDEQVSAQDETNAKK